MMDDLRLILVVMCFLSVVSGMAWLAIRSLRLQGERDRACHALREAIDWLEKDEHLKAYNVLKNTWHDHVWTVRRETGDKRFTKKETS